jgi:hypothetical protein
MAEPNCGNCTFRAKYDEKPKSFLGRLWRWHANWCPGWKEYMNSLEQEKRQEIAQRYNIKKYLN